MNKYLLSGCVSLLAIGCASTPTPTESASPVPSERVSDVGKRYLNSAPQTGKVIVKRDSGIVGAACNTQIYVDGQAVAEIDVAEKVTLFLPVGDHILSAQPNNPCSGGMTELAAKVRPNETLVFRFGTSGQGSPSLYPTAF